ncbi:GNAT family N-acetyltransferase [Pseudomonas viridiflava]|uniref:GNAT family N-acetyltransferase n=1 Tax=Pseudomonas viridiflava TaxID=33069 RepID=UPI000C068B58|nr:GNAT family N-acetyltransferase [Pseudomonas viridiflava]MEE4308007.1 GNAT family N-acetyltransferase [Pseudomonas alliivorans]MEE4753861.1 GNAT family N-acetyltransferase [Pseudomonas alliivorans]MEE4893003.1 GNAT family N-acetyltransferase [Pseudomonas alliivorans]MEE4954751.1 GNAT family N-acetyltransferase [Pseudomonas alliivorans]MEE4965483.1 GNAT family N-acetyltransferase [Pseudomonas alliivorans]
MINTTPMELKLREAMIEDSMCVAVLGLQVFLDTYATDGIRESIAREALEAFSRKSIAGIIAQPEAFIIVAESRGHLVGFAQVALRTAHEMIDEVQAAELQRLYVQERFTGLGVGKRLLKAAEQQAALGGALLLWATVWVGNDRALDFYPQMGYGLEGAPIYVFQGEAHENRLYAKRLDGFRPGYLVSH